MNKNCITIIGYDLSELKTERYDDWKWTEIGEQYIDYQRTGNIQIFDDPASSNHLYFGYIVGICDEYEDETQKLELKTNTIGEIEREIKRQLYNLINEGVIEESAKDLPLQIISFVEYW